MKKDAEVKLYRQKRSQGLSQELAAAKAGMSERTARKYEKSSGLPSQRKQPRSYRTRSNPFVADWPWVEAQLKSDPALLAHTLFDELCRQYPGRYQSGQVRTLRRHIRS